MYASNHPLLPILTFTEDQLGLKHVVSTATRTATYINIDHMYGSKNQQLPVHQLTSWTKNGALEHSWSDWFVGGWEAI